MKSKRERLNPKTLNDCLIEIKIDIATIKNELKWHRYLITTILVILLTLLAKAFLF